MGRARSLGIKELAGKNSWTGFNGCDLIYMHYEW
jgi:hypothetical protein